MLPSIQDLMLNKQVERNLLEVNNIDVDFLESNARKLIARGVSFCDFYLPLLPSSNNFARC